MKISTKGRYGLRALIDLTIHREDKIESVPQIGKRQGISERYLEQVFATLKKEGFIESIKGIKGGYRLKCNPQTTTIKDILTVLEGELTLSKDRGETCYSQCVSELVWQPLEEALLSFAQALTLEQLALEYTKQQENCETMWQQLLDKNEEA